MATLERLIVKLDADMSGLSSDLKKAEQRLSKFGDKMVSVGKKLSLGVTLPLAAVGAASVKMASDAEEAANKFDVVMGASADRIRAKLEQLHDTIPLTTHEMEGLAAGIQDMLVPMGLARNTAADMSATMVELAGDLGSFNNVAPTQVLEAMQSALAGSSEPMRRFGVDTREAALEAVALANGLIEAGEKMDMTARAQAVLLAIQKDSTDAMGDAARTADSAANTFKFLARDLKELGILIGNILLPAVMPLLRSLGDALRILNDLDPAVQKILVGVGIFAAAGGPLILATGYFLKLAAAVKVLTGASIALNAALATGSLGAIAAGGGLIIGLAALAGGLSWLVGKMKSTTTEFDLLDTAAADTTDTTTNLLRSFRPDLWEQLKPAISGVTEEVKKLKDEVKKLDDAWALRAMDEAMERMEALGKAFNRAMREATGLRLAGSSLVPERDEEKIRERQRRRFEGGVTLFSPTAQARGGEDGGGGIGGVLGDVGEKMKGLGSSVMGVLSALNPWQFLLEAIQRALGDFIANMTPIVELLATALMPILEALFPVFKLLAIAATYVGQIFFNVAGGIATAIGWLIRAIGKAIDALPFISGKSIIKAGQAMMDLGGGFIEAAGDLASARDEIKALEWKDAMDDLADSASKAASALKNVPTGFKVALARFNATTPGMPGSGGGSSGPRGRDPNHDLGIGSGDGLKPITITGDLHFHGVQDVEKMERQVRDKAARGGTTTLRPSYARGF